MTNVHRANLAEVVSIGSEPTVAFSGFAGLDTTVEFDKGEGALG